MIITIRRPRGRWGQSVCSFTVTLPGYSRYGHQNMFDDLIVFIINCSLEGSEGTVILINSMYAYANNVG